MMTSINVAAASTAAALLPATGSAADATAAAADPFLAILLEQMSAAAGQPLTTAIAANASDAAAADPLRDALATLAAAMADGEDQLLPATKGAGQRKATDTGTDSIDPAMPLIATLAIAVAAPPSQPTATVAAEAEPQRASPLPTATASVAANLAVKPDVAAGDMVPAEKADATTWISPQASMHAAATSHTSNNPHVAVATSPVTGNLGSPTWNNEVANSVVWMVGQQQSRAELVLNPPALGRVEVSLTVSGDQASATFVSASPAVREALENAMPRLREVLADAGVTLAQAHVGADTSGRSANGGENGDNAAWNQASRGIGSTAATVAPATVASWTSQGRGMVDVFA